MSNKYMLQATHEESVVVT